MSTKLTKSLRPRLTGRKLVAGGAIVALCVAGVAGAVAASADTAPAPTAPVAVAPVAPAVDTPVAPAADTGAEEQGTANDAKTDDGQQGEQVGDQKSGSQDQSGDGGGNN